MSDTDIDERVDKPEVHDNVVWNGDEELWQVHIRIVHASGVRTINETFAPLKYILERDAIEKEAEREFDREVERLDREGVVAPVDGPRPRVEVREDVEGDRFIVDRWDHDHERWTLGARLAFDIQRDHFPHDGVHQALTAFFEQGLDRDVRAWGGEPPVVEELRALAPPPNPFRIPNGDEVQRAARFVAPAPHAGMALNQRVVRGPGGFLENARRRQAEEARRVNHERMQEMLERMPAVVFGEAHAGQPIDVQELRPEDFGVLPVGNLFPEDLGMEEEHRVALGDWERAQDNGADAPDWREDR